MLRTCCVPESSWCPLVADILLGRQMRNVMSKSYEERLDDKGRVRQVGGLWLCY